jgi:hypothetical protein
MVRRHIGVPDPDRSTASLAVEKEQGATHPIQPNSAVTRITVKSRRITDASVSRNGGGGLLRTPKSDGMKKQKRGPVPAVNRRHV